MSYKKIAKVISSDESWFANKEWISEFMAIDILSKEKISICGGINAISTSTNAVCCTDNCIIKIYMPETCGHFPLNDLEREVYALELINTTKVRVPQLIAYGFIDMETKFYYSVTERINIPQSESYISKSSDSDIITLGRKLRESIEILQSLEIKTPSMSKCKKTYEDSVFVHGDLTGHNVLYDGVQLAIIDFEDWQFVPANTELPAIVFDMIHSRINLASAFLGIPLYELKNRIFEGMNIHHESHRFIERYNEMFM